MIIRETETHFIMIEQHEHARISEQLVANLRENLIPTDDKTDSLFYAICQHDVGWIYFDAEPIWNDEKQAPYSFIDYPNAIKTVLYNHGIDEVAKEDLYAGLLCSKHYALFLERDPQVAAREFVEREELRQKVIIESLKVDEEVLDFHFDFLKLADDLSLFLCIHEPGTSRENVHYFFEKGIRLPKKYDEELGERLHFEWLDEETLATDRPFFREAFTVEIPLKKVEKAAIQQHGLRKSYNQTAVEWVNITLK